jgi:hypothetical protein
VQAAGLTLFTVSPMSATPGEAVRRGLLSLGEVLRLEGFQTDLHYPPDDDPGAAEGDSGGGARRPGFHATPSTSSGPRGSARTPRDHALCRPCVAVAATSAGCRSRVKVEDSARSVTGHDMRDREIPGAPGT